MPIEVGQDIEGKVTGITNYGAFVDLGEGNVGLVHISQVASAYVTDINQFLKIGDMIKVRVLGKVKDGKYDLSIKQAGQPARQPGRERVNLLKRPPAKDRPVPGSFEDKITQFLKNSEERLLDLKRNLEEKQGTKQRKR